MSRVELFVTSETAGDVDQESLRRMFAIGKKFNRLEVEVKSSKINLIGIILVIMDSDIVRPIDGGVRYHRRDASLDVRVPLNFNLWRSLNHEQRAKYFLERLGYILKTPLRRFMGEEDSTAVFSYLARCAMEEGPSS
jgi:hypothetical protein